MSVMMMICIWTKKWGWYHNDLSDNRKYGNAKQKLKMMNETITGNMNKNCEQIQKNFNVVDDDDVIKHNIAFGKIKETDK